MNIASLNLTVLDQTKTKWTKLGTGVGNDNNGDQVAPAGLFRPPMALGWVLSRVKS
jgi:hypothetical protein